MQHEYTAHDAVEDVIALRKLVEYSRVKVSQQKKHTISMVYVRQQEEELPKLVAQNLPSLRPLVDSRVLSTQMAKKIAESNLNLSHLKMAFERDGSTGIISLFSEDCRGKPKEYQKTKK